MSARVITTAYGHAALEALREVVSAAKADDPMAPVTIVVPNNIAGIVARRYLAAGLVGRGPGVAALHLTTIRRLAEQLAAGSLQPRMPATPLVGASFWRRALTERPGVFAPVAEHPATIRALSAAHQELRDLSADALARARGATPLAAEVVRLHEDVTASMRTGWFDSADLLSAAAELIASHPAQLSDQGSFVLYLPQLLSQNEAALMREAGQHCELTVVAGMTSVQRADQAVLRSLGRLGCAQLAKSAQAPTATRVLHASDADDEVRVVVRAVADALTRHPAHRVAVLYTSVSPYGRLLHEHLGSSGLTVNGPSTRAVHERALARSFLSILRLAETQTPRAATFRALAEAPTLTVDGSRVPVARWERISRAAAITGGPASDWTDKLDVFIADQRDRVAALEKAEDRSRAAIEAVQRRIDDAQKLSAFYVWLHGELERGLTALSWAELSTWALELFHRLYGAPDAQQMPREEQYAAVVVEQALRGVGALQSIETRADLHGLIEVLDLELEAALPRVGRFGEGVFVGPVSAAVGLELDQIFVVGLSEDLFPGRVHVDALLNEEVRAATQSELRTPRDDLDAKHRHLLVAFASAPEVTASFARGDLRRSTERLPSRFLLHSLRALSGDPNLPATEWHRAAEAQEVRGSESFAKSVETTETLASEQEWRVRAVASGGSLGEPAVDAAHDMLAARASAEFTRFDGSLEGAEGLPDYARDGTVVSPTALESYAVCPHGFFMRRLLRVEPLEQPEEILQISPADLGTLVHECLDALVSEAAKDGTLPSFGEPWTSEHRARLRQIAEHKAEEVASRGLTGHPRLWAPERLRVIAELERMLDWDSEWRKELDAEVVASELEFGMNGIDPIGVEVEHGTVHLRGSADKVDKTRDGVLLVTDVKTGKATKFVALASDPVAAGTKLQLPAYAHAAKQRLGGDSAVAQYWFVLRENNKRVGVPLDESVEQQYANTLATLVASIAAGLFPGKPSEKPGYRYVECEYCTPDGLGHEVARERYERKRSDPALRALIRLIDPEAAADPESQGSTR